MKSAVTVVAADATAWKSAAIFTSFCTHVSCTTTARLRMKASTTSGGAVAGVNLQARSAISPGMPPSRLSVRRLA
jgi:hypothetical protein